MLIGKQRAYLRGLANDIQPIFQVGKNGIEASFLNQVRDALEKRELIKIKVLENSGLEAREASDHLCAELKCEGVQAIGSKIVLYKRSSKNPKIEIPRKFKNVKNK
ncbi:MAG: YhbY family RNA-binding protein [Clostridium sp.]|uniref:YhbY family RNA-binding protein n=1 Tax=Clostridium sp. TaxID=1506 RepID=UPI002FC5EC65